MKTKEAKPKRREVATVGFSITGEFITNQARTFWHEGEYVRAFKILECLIGSTREQHEAILFGRSKLVGVNELDLVPDDWTPPDGYVTLEQALERGEHYHELEQRRIDEAFKCIESAAYLELHGYTGKDAAEQKDFMRRARALIGDHDAAKPFHAFAEVVPSRAVHADFKTLDDPFAGSSGRNCYFFDHVFVS